MYRGNRGSGNYRISQILLDSRETDSDLQLGPMSTHETTRYAGGTRAPKSSLDFGNWCGDWTPSIFAGSIGMIWRALQRVDSRLLVALRGIRIEGSGSDFSAYS